jgi:TRAP-type C4-dicarboxylate transport system permease small subunit
MPSLTPIASLYAAIPIAGALIALFTVEQLVNGCARVSVIRSPGRPSLRQRRF